ncbi:MAG: multicopper oxidase domain-containing protein, partial [Candidatus Longimicrobiales bacterium M2_2A_002]
MTTRPAVPGLGPVSRRNFLRYAGATGAVASLERLAPEYAGPYQATGASRPLQVLDGRDGPIEIEIAETTIDIGGRSGRAITMNGTVPGPLIRFRDGGEAVMHVTNRLEEDTSIHWHGIILPNAMDGVPEVNFPGIRPGETFTYRYPVRQAGTYWYHSHSGLQEQLGHYGPMVIDPAKPEPYEYDRDYVVVLSDWTFENPYRVLAKLKKSPDYYNFQKRTVWD